MLELEVRCRCGQVTGRATEISPGTINRAICYCDDCQAAAHHLGRAELLDEHGGTEVVQLAPAALHFVSGTEHLAALRLSPKGLHRWHSRCCQTPLGNTLTPGVPFVGIQIGAFTGLADAAARDAAFGLLRGRIQRKFAIGTPPADGALAGLRLGAHVVRLLARWKLSRAWPNPFFSRDGQPRYPITVLTRDQRAALRPRCGPHPTAS